MNSDSLLAGILLPIVFRIWTRFIKSMCLMLINKTVAKSMKNAAFLPKVVDNLVIELGEDAQWCAWKIRVEETHKE